MIEITLNGKNMKLEDGLTLKSFVEKYLPKDKFAIEVNLSIVPKSEYETFLLTDGMKIEAITFVGGG